jgi:hypothetical protein
MDSHKAVSAAGGKSTLKKYGKKHYSEMGKKGAKTKLKKYGKDYFKKIRKLVGKRK